MFTTKGHIAVICIVCIGIVLQDHRVAAGTTTTSTSTMATTTAGSTTTAAGTAAGSTTTAAPGGSSTTTARETTTSGYSGCSSVTLSTAAMLTSIAFLITGKHLV